MSPRKLSDNDRQNILKLYRNSAETTSSLANRYEVSNSTISRFLKSSLSESEYEDLIQQKRLTRTSHSNINSDQDKDQKNQESEENLANDEDQVKQVKSNLEDVSSSSEKPLPIVELKSSPPEEETTEVISQESITKVMNNNPDNIEEKDSSVEQDLEALKVKNTDQSVIYLDEEEDLESLNIIGEMFGEDLSDDDDDDLSDDDDDDDDDLSDDDDVSSQKISNDEKIEILPISEASFPRTSYVVIDHNAELITRPLKDFADLGDIPSEELLQETLPIFDNHRVAKRFSHRRGKIIKITDGNLFKKTANCLYQKGITRILIEGKIYCLS